MTNWKELFEDCVNDFEDKKELGLSHDFGTPATDSEIEQLESFIQLDIPESLKELFSQFNGITATDKFWGTKPLYLSTFNIINDVPKYIKESDNYFPPNEELSKVVFIAQQNGYALLFAMCISPFGEFEAGEILVLESDTGEFEKECESLYEFVSSSEYCHLG